MKAQNLEKSGQNIYTYTKTNSNETQSKTDVNRNGAIDETLNTLSPSNEPQLQLNSLLDKDWQRSAAFIKRDYKLTSKTKYNLRLDNLTLELEAYDLLDLIDETVKQPDNITPEIASK